MLMLPRSSKHIADSNIFVRTKGPDWDRIAELLKLESLMP